MHTEMSIPTIVISTQKPLTVVEVACLCLASDNLPTEQTKSTLNLSKSKSIRKKSNKTSIEI